MPVETRSRTHMGDSGNKEKTDNTVKRTGRKKRGHKETELSTSGEETSTVKVPKSSASVTSCREEVAQGGHVTAPVATTEPFTMDSNSPSTCNPAKVVDTVQAALPSESPRVTDRDEENGGKSGHCSDDKASDVGAAAKGEPVIESASIPGSEIGDVAQHVREVYKKETCARNQIKGKPKSGRTWKTEQTARFSDLRKDKPLKSSWERKMAQKAEKLSVRKYQQELQDAKRQEIELKKQRRAEHKKRKEENQKKSEIVQEIRNTAKLKRMKKKQLRRIEKR